MTEEIKRVAHYLDSKSEAKITQVVEREVIGNRMKLLVEMENSSLISMLIDNKYDDLGRMYTLFRQISTGLQMREIMIAHLRETRRQLVTDLERLKDLVEFVQRLLDEKDKQQTQKRTKRYE